MPTPRAEKLPSGRFRGIATIAGKRHYETFDSQGQALAWADTTMRRAAGRERDAGQLAARPVPTVEQFLEPYLSSLDVEAGTLNTYRSWLKPALEEFGDRPLADDQIETMEIRQWVAAMRRGAQRKRCSPRTAQARLKQFRAYLGAAIEAGHLTKDPTRGIKLPKVPKMPHRIVARGAEEDALLDAAAEHRMLDAVLLAIDEGPRWGEVYGLHVASVDLSNARVTISDVLERPDYTPRGYPKGKKYRALTMTERVRLALADRIDSGAGIVRCPDGRRCPSGGWLLFGDADKPTRYDTTFAKQWDAVVRLAGLTEPALTFHDLRHTFGTRVAEYGTPVHVIRDMLGHETTDTAQTYIDAASNALRDAWLLHAMDGGPSPLASLARLAPL